MKELAEAGHPAAQNILGMFHLNHRNFSEALTWFRKAEAQGNLQAISNLGFMYYNGFGVPQSDSKAFEFYLKAAEKGNAGAQNNIGMMYSQGRGVKQDYKRACLWYKKAADQGDSTAQNNLGYMFENGMGVKQNLRAAVYLYTKAAEQNLVSAKLNLAILFRSAKQYSLAREWYQKALEQGKRENNSEIIRRAQEGLELISDKGK